MGVLRSIDTGGAGVRWRGGASRSVQKSTNPVPAHGLRTPRRRRRPDCFQVIETVASIIIDGPCTTSAGARGKRASTVALFTQRQTDNQGGRPTFRGRSKGMNPAAAQSSAKAWRVFCSQYPQRFCKFDGTPENRRHVERCESAWIKQLTRADLPLTTRAVAFRSIMELRACVARDVATFFDVDPQVIVIGLSLLELPRQAAIKVKPSARRAKPRTKAA
jgi:hypothetical protein